MHPYHHPDTTARSRAAAIADDPANHEALIETATWVAEEIRPMDPDHADRLDTARAAANHHECAQLIEAWFPLD